MLPTGRSSLTGLQTPSLKAKTVLFGGDRPSHPGGLITDPRLGLKEKAAPEGVGFEETAGDRGAVVVGRLQGGLEEGHLVAVGEDLGV